MATYLISELAERAGVPPTTLRYYEQAGLLPAARSANGYRRYGDDAVDRLALIRAGQHLGLPLGQLRDLLTVRDSGACADVRARLRPLLAARIAQARGRAAAAADSITRLEQALAATVPARGPGPCDSACGCLTGPAPRPGATTSADNSKKNPDGPQPLPPQKTPSPQKQTTPLPEQEPIACSLDGDGQEARLAEWRDLLALGTAREPVANGIRVTLPAALAGSAAELAAAEQRCCPFFRFTLVFDGGDVRLTVQAPPEAGPLLAAFTDEPGRPVSLYRPYTSHELRRRGRPGPLARGERVR